MTVAEFVRQITGRVIPAVPVPFRSDGTIHVEAQQRHIEYMAARRVGAVAVWAHTGRGLHLSPDQRRLVLSAWRSGSRVPIIAGVGACDGTDPDASAVRMAEEALRGGADALLVHPPTPYRDYPDARARILGYHQALDRLGAPLILFDLYTDAGGVPYPPELLRELLALPSVAGVKLATMNDCVRVQDTVDLLRAFPGKIPITGEDRFLEASIMWGCTSALIGIASARTDLSVELLAAYMDGRYQRFVELAKQLDRFARFIFRAPMEGYIRRMLEVLVIEKVIPPSAAFDPFGPALTEEDLLGVHAAVRDLDAVAPQGR
ncbi:MAG: dihydrodipicolinate synthase family protein [Armatimonadota bacterium]|nr:dihydrodipicolinate synthase family protein [Armatimonadota bacterium]MDR7467720.1 dihydrodipicolinate synthase family protein [Armatimonadota bacterium]MDR7499815.1 dihydrodipicolinate synthase family protein [Armatimonadota bacterium]MDR7505239.1 dihydrodipicolinate synthase family protein [Armatimonadota bacterium]MDR7573941.1 dihydrodipicolinate synthase family protein [Armatimonadota bacterium]